MPGRDFDQQQVYALITRLTGQANILTIPRLFIDWTDDHITALFLSQIIYWSSRTNDPDGWFYKSAKEWEEELAISPFQLARATKKLSEAGLETRLKKIGGAPTQHYRLDQSLFTAWVYENIGTRNLDFQETVKSKFQKPGNPITTNSQMHSIGTRESISQKVGYPLTETTTETTYRELFEASKNKQHNITLLQRTTIGRYLEDFSREFRDDAPLSSSTTRAVRIFTESNLSIDDFVDAMLEARRRTQERSGGIQKTSTKGRAGEKAKMPYWFSVLEDLIRVKLSSAG